MPCRCDWPDDRSVTYQRTKDEYRAKIDTLTQDLCFLCGTLQDNGILGNASGRILEWWAKHKDSDERRVRMEMENYIKKSSLSLKDATAIANYFIAKAEKVHPVSSFHKKWFLVLAEEAVQKSKEKKATVRAQNKLMREAKKKLLDTLSKEEIEALNIKV